MAPKLRTRYPRATERGPTAVKPVAGRIAAHLEQGDSLEHALKDERDTFPPLFITMAMVGEQAGALPEAFAELEKYFQLQQKLRRQFRSRVFGPLLLWGVAVLVFGLVMVVLDLLRPGTGAGPSVFGLRGIGGAALFAIEHGLCGPASALGILLRRRDAFAGTDIAREKTSQLLMSLRGCAAGRGRKSGFSFVA